MFILDWTREEFGPRTSDRYAKLIRAALDDVRDDPDRFGAMKHTALGESCRTYHLSHSRKNVRGTRVKQPRHMLLFRVVDDVVEIGRVLHDGMTLDLHLPADFRNPGSEPNDS